MVTTKTNQTKITKQTNSYQFVCFVIFVYCLFLTGLETTVSAQSYSKTFSVPVKGAEIEIINQIGSIKVTAGPSNSGRVVINARHSTKKTTINAVQLSPDEIKVEVEGRGAVDFEVVAPPSTELDLFTYKGSITVANSSGKIKARITTDGNIAFTGVRSKKVEAHSASGNVSFNGEILPDGKYTLKSFSGRLDATIPSDAEFRLSASSHKGVVDLGGFPMKFDRQTSQLVEAVCVSAKAEVTLWTQEGNIYLHRKP